MLSLLDWRARPKRGEGVGAVAFTRGKSRPPYYAIEAEVDEPDLAEAMLAVVRVIDRLCWSRPSTREWKVTSAFVDDVLRQVEETRGVVETDVFEGVIEAEPEAIVDEQWVLETDVVADSRSHETDLDWFGSNLEELRGLHAGQWIAIVDGVVCASAPDLRDLREALETAGMATPLVTFVPDQEVTWRTAYGLQDV
jgi:hypothetical protein